MKRLIALLAATGFVLAMAGCGGWKQNAPADDSPTKGRIGISVDNSFEPVFREQIAMYEASYPGTEIVASYKPEVDCIRDLLYDSTTRLVVITRRLNETEEKYLMDSLQYIPGTEPIAYDAVVVLVNPRSKDTLLTMDNLRALLTGKAAAKKQVIFDGKNATSTVRFIQDSLLRGNKFDTAFVTGAASTQEVIDQVAADINSIGLIGFNRIGNPEDPEQVKNLQRVKMAYVQCEQCEGKPFVYPMQNSINTRRYPLVRTVYFVMKENYMGLGTGFTSFLKYERGQLIFRRAYLGTIMDFDIRNVRYNDSLPPDDEL